MDFTLKTTTADIRSTASRIDSGKSTLTQLISEASQFANRLGNIWQGTNASVYLDRFNKAKQDLNDVLQYYTNYSSDLKNAANAYDQNVNTTTSQSSNLRTDVITAPR